MKRKLLTIAAALSAATLTTMAKKTDDPPLETITFAAGCFWCVEAVFQQLDGVETAVSGYMGGQVENPSYKAVCSGDTGHAEVVQLAFNPEMISARALIDFFWKQHDPTSLNRQGADVGTQYRSAIFYHNDAQREAAEASKAAAQASDAFSKPIVTEIAEAKAFYKAESYHQEFYELNKNHPYCRAVIAPKLKKLGL